MVVTVYPLLSAETVGLHWPSCYDHIVRARLLIWVPCFVLALLYSYWLYDKIIHCFFILDDFVWLDCARQAQKDLSQVFGLEISNFFRPVAHLYFAAMFAVFETAPPPYHVANLVANALCATLLAHLAYLLSGERWTALLAGLFFVVIPTYTEIMVWISAITEPIHTIFLLLTLIGWYHYLMEPKLLRLAAVVVTFLAALGSKESSVVLLPVMVLTHMGLAATGRTRRISPWIYLPFALMLLAYLVFQYWIQQKSYLVKTGVYEIGLHGLAVLGMSVLHILQDAWPPLAAALTGAVITRVRWADAKSNLRLAGILLGALVAVLMPYTMFGSGHLPGRYFHLGSMVMALVGALALAGVWRRNRTAGWVLATVALIGMAVNTYRISLRETSRYTRVAAETSQFINQAAHLPPLDTPIIIVDGRLWGQHLKGAMRLFRHGHKPVVRFYNMKYRQLPPVWRSKSVWQWDSHLLKFRELIPPRPRKK